MGGSVGLGWGGRGYGLVMTRHYSKFGAGVHMGWVGYTRHMGNQVQSTGVIIARRDVGEADRWFVVFSPDLGKISCMARGIRKPKARLAAWMDLLRYNDLTLTKRRAGGYVLTGAQTKLSWFDGTESWERLTSAYYVCELIDRMFEEGVVVPGVFELVRETLARLAVSDRVAEVRASFELKLLEVMGLSPQLYKCAVCGEEMVAQDKLQFSARLGGVAKMDKAIDDFAVAIEPNAVKLMRLWQRYPFDAIEKVGANEAEVAVAAALVSDFTAYVLEYRAKALRA